MTSYKSVFIHESGRLHVIIHKHIYRQIFSPMKNLSTKICTTQYNIIILFEYVRNFCCSCTRCFGMQVTSSNQRSLAQGTGGGKEKAQTGTTTISL